MGGRWVGVFLASSTVWITACGEDTSGTPSGDLPAQTCSAPAACGGDLSGTWQIQDDCLPTQTDAACSGANFSLNADTLSATGTVEFDADGTEHFSENVSLKYTVSGPSSCLGSNCEDSGSDLSSALVAAGYQISNTSCASKGALCDCTLDATAAQSSQVSYTTSGSNLVQTLNGTQTTSTFCVSGTTLTIVSPQGEVTTATKQ
jgi:hypothetical protein